MKTKEQIKDDWYEFANNAFIEWRGPTRKTLTEFAEWIGLSQPVISMQLKKGGKVPRDQKTIDAWCRRYGVKQIYTILGIPIRKVTYEMSPELIQSLSKEIGETFKAKGLKGGEPEAFEIVKEIMIKHGLNVTSTRDNSMTFSS